MNNEIELLNRAVDEVDTALSYISVPLSFEEERYFKDAAGASLSIIKSHIRDYLKIKDRDESKNIIEFSPPVFDGDDGCLTLYICPVCRTIILHPEHANYCVECGQKLSWNGTGYTE